MPSSRQIIPLTGRPRAQGTQSGSLTVEVGTVRSLYGKTSAYDTLLYTNKCPRLTHNVSGSVRSAHNILIQMGVCQPKPMSANDKYR